MKNNIYFFTGEHGFAARPAAIQPSFLNFPRAGLWAGIISYEGKEKWIYCDKVEKISLEDLRPRKFALKNLKPNLTLEKYSKKITKIKKYLKDGESYQVNFAIKFDGNFEGDPLGLFVEMQKKNPAEMAFYYDDGETVISSNSPERLFSLQNGVLRAEPIKGTVAAGEDPSFLLHDEKSQAELTMIVDLLRNDLSRVGKNVRVPVHAAIMKLANVSHTYSVIEADLEKGKNALDVLRALFPGGSVTGCPKIRTMEIIKKLEGFKRGFYCGSAGFILPNGDAEFNINIRTAILKRKKPSVAKNTLQNSVNNKFKVSFYAGGGILIDSNATGEYHEALKKSEIIINLQNV